MRSRNLVIAFGFVAAVVATSAAAHAQPAPAPTTYPAACAASSVPASESEKAHAIYQAGKVQYDEAKYDAAIAQFRDAYKRDCSKHDLLVIISRANELKGDRAEAIRALELYIEREKPDDAATHRARIESLKSKLEAAPPAPPPPPPPAQDVREHTIPPWIVVGVGGAAIVTGIIFHAAAPELPKGCEPDAKDGPKCTMRPGDTKADVDERGATAGRSQGMPIAGTIFILGGAGLVGAGLLWHFLEPTGPAPAATGALKPKIKPSVAPGYAGLSLGGTF